MGLNYYNLPVIAKSDADVHGRKEFNDQSFYSIREQQIGKSHADVLYEPFGTSPPRPGSREEYAEEFSLPINEHQIWKQDTDASIRSSINVKDNTRENNVAKIRVVVCSCQHNLLYLDLNLNNTLYLFHGIELFQKFW